MSVRPRRSVVWSARLLALVLSTAAGLAAVELVLRLGALAPGPQPLADPEAAGLPVVEKVAELAKPNQRSRYRGALYTTNSRGLRDEEYARAADHGTFRIAVMGDSYTMGSGVRQAESYPELLEVALNGVGDPGEYEVINLGLSGLSLAGSLDQRLIPIGLDYRPDMIVYGFTVNDVEGPAYVSLPRMTRTSWGSMLLDLLHERWDYLRDLTWPSASSYVRELDYNFFENPDAWSSFEAQLDRLAAVGPGRGICAVVLIHTQLTALHRLHPFKRHYAAVVDAARTRGLFVVDAFPWFEGVDPSEYRCGVHDWHPNAAGHQILSEALLRYLRSLPSECWTGAENS